MPVRRLFPAIWQPSPFPAVTEAWIIGAFAPPEVHTPEAKAALGVSDELVDELLTADRYLFGVPMYNLNIPSTFKSYIDQVVRVGRTFSVGAAGYEGLVKGKKAIFVTSSGGSFQPGSPYAPYNFQEPYLRAIFGFIGITDIQFVVADSQNLGEAPAQSSVAKAEAVLNDLRNLVVNELLSLELVLEITMKIALWIVQILLALVFHRVGFDEALCL